MTSPDSIPLGACISQYPSDVHAEQISLKGDEQHAHYIHHGRSTHLETDLKDGAEVRFISYSRVPMTIREAIEAESAPDHTKRPSWHLECDYWRHSVHGIKVGKAPRWHKWRNWLLMWISSPGDALLLLFINRHPPAVTWTYDDSDDWPNKRWRRALSLHRNDRT